MSPKRLDQLCRGIVLGAMVAAFAMMVTNLGHPSLKGLDESFHAVVAQHLIDHPLTPTLYEKPFLDFGDDWQHAHVWLHKPPVALWQMAAAMAIGGVNTLAMRLPSAILLCASAWLTFCTVRRLANPAVAIVPAVIQLLLPATWMLAYGYAFSDHVDVAMLFWTQAAMLLLVRSVQTGHLSDAAWCGVAQGVAWLTKSHPAFIVTGVAAFLFLATRSNRFAPSPAKLSGRQFVVLIGATLATILPWTLYTAIRFPQEFAASQGMILHHLTQNVENFAAPWDRLLFDYLPQLNLQFLPIGLAAGVIVARAAWRDGKLLWLLPPAWWIGFIVPHVVAVAKTPSQTMPAIPALLMLIGLALAEVRRERFAAVTLLTSVLLAIVWRRHPETGGFGYPPDYHFGQIARQNLWVIVEPAIAATVGFLSLPLRGRPGGGGGRLATPITIEAPSPHLTSPRGRGTGMAIVIGLAILTVSAGRLCWQVTRIPDTGLALRQIGPFVRGHLEPNVVLLVEEQKKLERTTVMFYTARNAYAVTAETGRDVTARVKAAGGVPYLLSARDLPLPIALRSPSDGRTLYRIP